MPITNPDPRRAPGQADETAHSNRAVAFHQAPSPLATGLAEFLTAVLPVITLLLEGSLLARQAQGIGKSASQRLSTWFQAIATTFRPPLALP